MKSKILSLLALGIAVFGMASCSDDNDSNPVIDTKPTKFVLNTPTMSEQHVQLSAENTVTLAWSAPDYDFLALPTYFVQVGVKQADGTIAWDEVDGKPYYLETTYNSVKANVPGEEIAMSINSALGFKSEDEYTDKGYIEVAFRIHAAILDGEGVEIPVSTIESNTVTFKYMSSYKAIRAPKTMFVIGAQDGWIEPTPDNKPNITTITETGVGTGIYKGTLSLGAGKFQFRFYTALTGWDGGASIGPQADDKTFEIALKDNVYEGTATVPGKGSWSIPDWEGGDVVVILDLNKNTVRFEKK